MEHPDWPAFATAIIADPDDDTVRLAAADFLEEHGDADRATFIRIQVDLARLQADGEGKHQDDIDRLRLKEREFLGPLSVAWKLWAAEECPELVKVTPRDGSSLNVEVTGSEHISWGRGFIEGVECPAEFWSRHGSAIRRRLPIRSVILTSCDQISRGQWYGMIPSLRLLRIIMLQGVDQSLGRWLQGWLTEGERILVP